MVSMTRKRVKLGRRNNGLLLLSMIQDRPSLVLGGALAGMILFYYLMEDTANQTGSVAAPDHRNYFGNGPGKAGEEDAHEFDSWLSMEDYKFPNRHRHRPADEFPREESLRYSFDLAHGVDPQRTTDNVLKERALGDAIPTMDAGDMTYNIHDCPATPPPGYPYAWSAIDVLSHWNADDTRVPDRIYQGLCWFDWSDSKQRDAALTYRQAELPFLIRNHDEIWRTAERWTSRKYMLKLVGQDKKYKTEHSKNNQMMYWKLRKNSQKPPGWQPPTDITKLSFPDWYQKAIDMEQYDPDNGDAKPIIDKEHWYFRLNAAYNSPTDYVYDELPMFVPTQPGFFMVDPSDERGINCRFGMKGIVAATHYDMSRNFIFILKGQKRYILAHPNQCGNLMLHPSGHPSGRHSSIDWSNPDEWQTGNFPQAKVNEVVLQAGDALYLPTAWFHFIVSLNLNYQCNARSGITYENKKALLDCGF